MQLALKPVEILMSIAGGAAVALLVVLVLAQFSPARPPVRATLVNCAPAPSRARQGRASSASERRATAERNCAELEAPGGSPSPDQEQAPDPQRRVVRATRTPRTHGWRKAATPQAN